MKILMLGDYSSFHWNLKEGVEELGHRVTVAAAGSGWRRFNRDIDLQSSFKGAPGFFDTQLRMPFKYKKEFSGYDVVQFVGPVVFHVPFINRNILPFAINNNAKSFMMALGDDSYYWKNLQKMKYSPVPDYKKYDQKWYSINHLKKSNMRWNEWLSNNVDGVIPIMYDYYLGYRNHKNLKPTIPLAVNTQKIKYEESKPGKKLVIFHGLNRVGFKGTNYIRKAFEILKKKYPNDLELIIRGGMPYDDYLKLMSQTNIVLDQTSSYSCGVSGILALAQGKVVLGGAEAESIKHFGLESSPIINITPDPQQIVREIENILERRAEIPEMGYASRKFVEEFHDYRKVAEQYVKVWQS